MLALSTNPGKIPIVSEAREAVEKALEGAELRVGRMPPTPGARELSGRLSKYRHIVAGCIHPPVPGRRPDCSDA
jgi:hypothetical protein